MIPPSERGGRRWTLLESQITHRSFPGLHRVPLLLGLDRFVQFLHGDGAWFELGRFLDGDELAEHVRERVGEFHCLQRELK